MRSLTSKLSIVAMIALLFTACKKDGPKENLPLKYSEEVYTLVRSGDGKAPRPGDYSIFSLMIKGDDGRVLLDRSAEENYAKFKLPIDTSQMNLKSPIDEMLTYLVQGDSATLVYELDSMERMNPAVAGLNSITYEINVKEVVGFEEMEKRNQEEQEKRDEKMAETKEKESLVAARTAEVLEAYKSGNLGEGLQKTESGMEYLVEKQGNGEIPKVGDRVSVHYYGILESDGSMFDNSYRRGDYFSFVVGQGQVIPGWDEALQLMPKGTEAVFFIPYELAYGAAGRPPQIPEKAMLVFYIEYPE